MRIYLNRVDIGVVFFYQMKVFKWLNVGVVYIVFNNFFINFGLGLIIDLGFMQGYFFMDNVFGLLSLGIIQVINVRMGFNIMFGRGYEEKCEEQWIVEELEEVKCLEEEE